MYPPRDWNSFGEPTPGPDETAPEPAESTSEEAIPLDECWRCGKLVDLRRGSCPICRAALEWVAPIAPEQPTARVRRNRPYQPADSGAIKAILWMFVILLVTSVIHGWVL